MNSIKTRLEQVRERIAGIAAATGRNAEAITLLAVSKTRPAEEIRAALDAGQHAFGENYLQEALEKISVIGRSAAEWHFIGRIQSNKTRPIAENFDWVHSIDSTKHAQRLNDQRPPDLAPLNICLQVNVDEEQSKGGFAPEALNAALAEIATLPNLRVRGLMTIPAPAEGFTRQCIPFRRLRQIRDQLATPQCPLETLSMGMSDDLEAAITEGATIVRVGTAIFGPRG